jgi:autotransporter-associated beta strand protein
MSDLELFRQFPDCHALPSGKLLDREQSLMLPRSQTGNVLTAFQKLSKGNIAGVFLNAGGTVNNLAGGTINGNGNDGVFVSGGAGIVTNSGTITGPDGVRFQVISGFGGLVKDGAGEVTLTAANTYTGGTTVIAETLQLGGGSTSGSIVARHHLRNGLRLDLPFAKSCLVDGYGICTQCFQSAAVGSFGRLVPR